MSRITVPILTPFLYESMEMAVIPISIILGVKLISPVFATRSHHRHIGLGVSKYHNLARAAYELGLNPIALGGLNETTAKRLALRSGQLPSYAAIDGFQPRTSLYFC